MPVDIVNEAYIHMHTGERDLFARGQIICVSQIQKGKRYEMVCTVKDAPEHMKLRQFEVVELPYQKDDGGWRMDVCYVGIGEIDTLTVHALPLRDYHLLPYENGEWNQGNFIKALEGLDKNFSGNLLSEDCLCRPYHP